MMREIYFSWGRGRPPGMRMEEGYWGAYNYARAEGGL